MDIEENQKELERKILNLPGVTGISIEPDGRIVVFTDGSAYYSEVDGVKVHCLKAGSKVLENNSWRSIWSIY
jgi:hypothetical protein